MKRFILTVMLIVIPLIMSCNKYKYQITSQDNKEFSTTTEFKEEEVDLELDEDAGNVVVKEVIGEVAEDNINKNIEEYAVNALIAPKLGKIEIGDHVKYKDEFYIVTQENENGTIQIYNPNLEGAKAKISVKKDNLIKSKGSSKIVSYQGSKYLVTPKQSIISLTSNSLMKWADNNGDRINILNLANNNITTPVEVEVKPDLTVSEVKAAEDIKVKKEFKPANKEQEVAISEIKKFIDFGKPKEWLLILMLFLLLLN